PPVTLIRPRERGRLLRTPYHRHRRSTLRSVGLVLQPSLPFTANVITNRRAAVSGNKEATQHQKHDRDDRPGDAEPEPEGRPNEGGSAVQTFVHRRTRAAPGGRRVAGPAVLEPQPAITCSLRLGAQSAPRRRAAIPPGESCAQKIGRKCRE